MVLTWWAHLSPIRVWLPARLSSSSLQPFRYPTPNLIFSIFTMVPDEKSSIHSLAGPEPSISSKKASTKEIRACSLDLSG